MSTGLFRGTLLSLGHLAVALIVLSGSTWAEARSVNLDEWFDNEAIPRVENRITTHPRFKGESLLFVVFSEGQAAPVSNVLAIGLRDRLLNAALDMPGVRIAWRQRGGASNPGCKRAQADYWIGIELKRTLSGQYRASVRALDVAEQSWVSGFGLSWRGTLRTPERTALEKPQSDPAFLGSRDVPYSLDQADLIAADLARKLQCEVSTSNDPDYVVALDEADADATPFTIATTLAARNLDEAKALRITAEPGVANARLSGTAHNITGSLHQYWLSITPLGTSGEIDGMSASVYVDIAAPSATARDAETAIDPQPAEPLPVSQPSRLAGVEMPGAAPGGLLKRLAVYRDGRGGCSTGRGCAVLEARALDDVMVYPLAYRPGIGLQRLGNGECQAHPRASVVTAGRSALFPVPEYGRSRREPAQPLRWLLAPRRTTYYAIAVNNAHDARKLGAHLGALPSACGRQAERGLAGLALERWLGTLSHLMLELRTRVQWRSLEVDTASGANSYVLTGE
ncbi:MAG: hypothetical protein AAGE85_07820 [Pseudomonadota bacterium]